MMCTFLSRDHYRDDDDQREKVSSCLHWLKYQIACVCGTTCSVVHLFYRKMSEKGF